MAGPSRTPPRRGPLRIAGLASHRGTNLRHIDDVCRSGSVNAQLVLLVSNNGDAAVLEYARGRGIPWRHLSGRTHPDPNDLDRAILEALREHEVDLVFLSGYMKKLGPQTVSAFRNRILNVHPSLLPRHAGQGMYGDRVYEAVLEAGETVTGATVHLVDEEYDKGPVVRQREVPVEASDTLERLRDRVRQCERELCVETITLLAKGELDLDQVARKALAESAPRP